MSIDDPNQLKFEFASHEGENVADSAPVISEDRHEDVPARANPTSPGPMSAREDHAQVSAVAPAMRPPLAGSQALREEALWQACEVASVSRTSIL
jgi:hypothetical protein